MVADKYLKNNSGTLQEVAFSQTSSGVGDAGKGVALNDQGKVDDSMLPSGIGAEIKLLVASEALSAGNWINIWDNASTPNVRKADATTSGKFCNGFVLAGVSQSATATVYLKGINNQVTGMTAGDVFLSITAGQGSNIPPTASGNVVQFLGTALSSTEVSFERGAPIVMA